MREWKSQGQLRAPDGREVNLYCLRCQTIIGQFSREVAKQLLSNRKRIGHIILYTKGIKTPQCTVVGSVCGRSEAIAKVSLKRRVQVCDVHSPDVSTRISSSWVGIFT